jgi:predicted esterase
LGTLRRVVGSSHNGDVSELLGFTYRFERRGTGDRTLLLLHGTGGNEDDLLPLGRMLDPEASILSPRGKVLEGGYPRFFRRFAEGVLDIEDLKTRTDELVRFVEAASTEHGFAGAQMIAVGYSNGANIAVSTLLLHPGVLQSAVLFRPMFPFEPESPPDLHGVGVFIASATNDPLIDRRDPERLAEVLEDGGADVTLEWSPAGHQLERPEVDAAKTWLHKVG